MEMERYRMFYEIKKKSNYIRILGEEFVKNNKNKGYIIYKHKKYPLQGLLAFQHPKNDKLKIQMLLSKDCYNKSCMFKDCSLLITFKCDYNINSIKDSLFKSENIYCLSDLDGNEKINFDNSKNAFNEVEYNFSFNIFESNKKLRNLNENETINNCIWNTKISIMNEIFSNCSSLISLPDISSWETSKIIDMNKIFYNCKSLSSIPDISKRDISNVIYMDKMFYNCLSLSLLPDIAKWKYK